MAQSVVMGFGAERAGGAGSDAAPWRQAHEELVRLAATRAGLDHEEGRWLLLAERARAHVRLGYGSFREYAERLFGYSPRLLQEKLRVAAALEELPLLSGALEHGKLSFSAVRELSRVATAATEGAWLEAVRGKSVREVEELVSGRKPGSLPGDLPDEGARRHVLRLEVSGEVLATFREAMATVRREAGEALDDDAAVLLLCRQALGGSRDDGRSSYQVALTVCEHCRRGMQQGRGELVEVPTEIAEMAACDAQDVGHVEHAHVGTKRATQTIAPAVRRRVMRRDGGRCRVPGCRHAVFTDVHHLRLRSEGGESTLENLVTLCSALFGAPSRDPSRGARRRRHAFRRPRFQARGRDAVRSASVVRERRASSEGLPGADGDGLPRDGSEVGARSGAGKHERQSRAARPASPARAGVRRGLTPSRPQDPRSGLKVGARARRPQAEHAGRAA